MKNVLIFAGTTEGRLLTQKLSKHSDILKLYVSVATSYGGEILQDIENINLNEERMNVDQMQEYILKNGIETVVDATHPYAVDVTQNIKIACEKSSTKLIRLLRDNQEIDSSDSIIYVDNVQGAVDFLKNTDGNILSTIGSKELKLFTQIPDYKARVFARVLPFSHVVTECEELGFKGRNLICMQGPFSTEFNIALIKMIDAKYIVTKESGSVGGFEEKIKSISELSCKAVVIKRPVEETGFDIFTVEKMILRGE